MQLGAPADGSKARGAASGVYGFIGNKVQPAVAALWDEEVASVVTAAKARGPMAVALDTAHSCVDNGQHSVTSAIDHHSKEICGVCTSCAGGAATREPVLTDLALDQVDAAGADVALAIVDGARDLQSSLGGGGKSQRTAYVKATAVECDICHTGQTLMRGRTAV
eukprot:COSAG01_NODE_2656_length_7304_cov_56.354615_5_plen_165_part_00